MKERLFYVMLGVFVGWLGLFSWLIMKLLANPEILDPMLSLIAGLGFGIITEFFILAMTLSWQYWFRKKESTSV